MAVEQKRARVLDLTRPGGDVGLVLEASEAAETLMSIAALADAADDETMDLGAAWLHERREAVDPELLAAVTELALGSMKLAAHLLGIVWETPAPRTFAAFLETLRATDALDLKRHLVGCFETTAGHHGLGPDELERAVLGEPAAVEAFLGSFAEWPDKQAHYRRLLEADAAGLLTHLLEILPRWHESVFLPWADDWRTAATRDVEAKRALAASRRPEELVEVATHGYQYAPPPAIRTIALFPSWWMRPWVVLWEHKGTKIFCYPIAAPATEEGLPPAEVARIYKALGDEGRLKLLRLLNAGPAKLSEAAAELGVAKSTAHHHLAILRQAGFVTIRDEDENVYALRHDLLPQAGELLAAYLGSSRSSATTA